MKLGQLGAVGLAWMLALVGCDSGPPGSDPSSCEGATAGAAGGPASDRVTLCALDERGAPIAGAEVTIGGVSAGTTDATGELDVGYTVGSAIEVRADGRVPHTLLGVSTERYGVVLAPSTAPTRTVSGTVSGINELPLPPDGFRRVVEIRAASRFTPLSLAEGLAVGAPAECTLAGDTCSFELPVDARVSHVNATVVDTAGGFSERIVAAFAASGAIEEGAADFAIPGRDGGLSEVSLDGGVDVVIGVPGSRIGDDVLLFGSPSATDTVPVPQGALGGNPWLAVIYDSASDELQASVVQSPSSSAVAPPAPGVEIDGQTLTLPAGRVSTISLGAGGEELWRATVLDGRSTLSIPTGDGDQVAVLVHGPPGEDDATEGIEAVVTLPITR